jgi:hypothetical protein
MTVERILMLVKTYPSPSEKYGEIVCTAGINIDTLEWRRVFPYPFRTVDEDVRFKKWDVIDMPLERTNKDKRPESRRLIDVNAIQKVNHIDVGDDFWTPRASYFKVGIATGVAEVLQQMLSEDREVWGPTIRIVRAIPGTARLIGKPQSVIWDTEKQLNLDRAKENLEQDMFADPELIKYFRTLERPPFSLRLEFQDLLNQTYSLPLMDWEFPRLLLKEIQNKGSKEAALESVRYKVEEQIFALHREPYLILGSNNHRYKKRQIGIIGYFSPRKRSQESFFEM